MKLDQKFNFLTKVFQNVANPSDQDFLITVLLFEPRISYHALRVTSIKNLFEIKNRENSELQIYVKIADQAHALKEDNDIKFNLTKKEKKYFFDTFTPICDEIFIEKVVPQWADTQLDKQNEVEDTGMYGQKINKWKDSCPFIFMYMASSVEGHKLI